MTELTEIIITIGPADRPGQPDIVMPLDTDIHTAMQQAVYLAENMKPGLIVVCDEVGTENQLTLESGVKMSPAIYEELVIRAFTGKAP